MYDISFLLDDEYCLLLSVYSVELGFFRNSPCFKVKHLYNIQVQFVLKQTYLWDVVGYNQKTKQMQMLINIHRRVPAFSQISVLS